MCAAESSPALKFRYKNHRGDVAERQVIPGRIYFGATEWHPSKQWLLEAYDLDKQAERTFALRDIQAWL